MYSNGVRSTYFVSLFFHLYMRGYWICVFILCNLWCLAQESTIEETIPVSKDLFIDPKYREDHFYITIAYNYLIDRPDEFSQNSFSTNFAAGYLRDIPLSEDRRFAVAPGVGLALNGYIHNLNVSENPDGSYTYDIVSENDITKNRHTYMSVELPFEIRWRNSTPQSHKFFRVYAGMKVGYIFSNTSIYEANEVPSYRINNNADINKLYYGTYLSFGYNTWNLFVYYSLTPIYKDVKLTTGEDLNMKTLGFGLQFYIL